jgi:hypothetical protein
LLLDRLNVVKKIYKKKKLTRLVSFFVTMAGFKPATS